MLHWALLDPVIHFFTKQSSIVGSLNNSRPSLLVYLEQVYTFVGKASAAMVCQKYVYTCCWMQVKKEWRQVIKRDI